MPAAATGALSRSRGADRRGRPPRWPTVGELADAEELMALPAVPYPATIEVYEGRRRQGQRGLPGQPLLGAPGDGRSRGHPAAPAGHRQPRGLLPLRASSSCPTAWPKPVPGPWCAPRPTGWPSKRWCSPSSPPHVPVTARPTSPPARPPVAERERLVHGAGTEPSVDLEAMAEIIALAFPGATEAGEVSA